MTIDVKDKILFLWCFSLRSFEDFKVVILYKKDSITTLEEVQATLKNKELTKFNDLKVDDSGECLSVTKGMIESGGKPKRKSRSKSRLNEFDISKYKCFICHKVSHFKKDCLEKECNVSSSV